MSIARRGAAVCAALLVTLSTTAASGREPVVVLDPTRAADSQLRLDDADRAVVAWLRVEDTSVAELVLTRCTDLACTNAGNPISVATGHISSFALEVDEDGRPAVAYATTDSIELLRCLDSWCGSTESVVLEHDALEPRAYAVLFEAGAPIVVAEHVVDGRSDTIAYVCADRDCADLSDERLITHGLVRPFVGSDGALFDVLIGHSISRCARYDCAGGSSGEHLPDVESEIFDLATDAAGVPTLAIWHEDGDDLVVTIVRCDVPSCATWSDPVEIHRAGGGANGWRSRTALPGVSLALHGDVPVVAFTDRDADLRLVRCGDPRCSSISTETVPDAIALAGTAPALTLTATGLPVVTTSPYGTWSPDPDARQLRLLRCDDPACADPGDASAAVISAAIDAAQQAFPIAPRPHVAVARADVFADALAGAVLTGTEGGPLLFTGSASLDPRTRTEIDRVTGGSGTVYLLGGTAALGPAIEAELSGAGYTVTRLAGASRVETALAVADEARRLNPFVADVAVARSAGAGDPTSTWADAVAAGAWSARSGVPVVLTPSSSLHPAVAAWLRRHEPVQRIVLGGTGAITEAVAAAAGATRRIAGPNRYATAATIASTLWPETAPDAFGAIATAGDHRDGWAYALAAASIAARFDRPLLLVETNRLPVETRQITCAQPSADGVQVIGPPEVVAQHVRDELDSSTC